MGDTGCCPDQSRVGIPNNLHRQCSTVPSPASLQCAPLVANGVCSSQDSNICTCIVHALSRTVLVIRNCRLIACVADCRYTRTDEALLNILASFQSHRLNKHFFLRMFDVCISCLLPEITSLDPSNVTVQAEAQH
eukprot:m.592067 g.592067  ORF g.592067 m.592067 type:complete len:135 (-) comp22389_c0_seq15:2280-2684(-)